MSQTATPSARTGTLAPWLVEPLSHLLRRQRGHAVLLAAPPGLGLFELGLAVATRWLCEAEIGEADPACGACASCRLVQARTHPDLLVLLPEALQDALGWSFEEGEPRSGKAKPSREIKVEALRRAVEFAQQTRSRARAKAVVIFPAERMNAIAANTLLKTLEEPPGDARFVLCTESLDALLPTIRSRCQIVPLHPPASQAAHAWLKAGGVAEPEVLLAAAGGQPYAACELAQAGIDAAQWRALPQRLARGDTQAVAGWPVPLLVQSLQKLCHDAMAVAVRGTPRYFPSAALQGLRADLPSLSAWARELARVARHEEHPWHGPLLVETLVAQARRHLNSPQ